MCLSVYTISETKLSAEVKNKKYKNSKIQVQNMYNYD